MGAIYSSLVAEQLFGAILFFSITWLIMGKKDGERLKVSWFWLIAGLLVVTFGAGTVRFSSIYVIGGEAALNPEGGASIFFMLLLPMLLSVAASALIRTKAVPAKKVGAT